MPKQQSNLDAFLGVQGKAKKQKTLTSFFQKTLTDKENDDNGVNNDTEQILDEKLQKHDADASSTTADKNDDDDETQKCQELKSKSAIKKTDSPRKTKTNSSKRRVILDDDDDDVDDSGDEEKMKDLESKSNDSKKLANAGSSSSRSLEGKQKSAIKKVDDDMIPKGKNAGRVSLENTNNAQADDRLSTVEDTPGRRKLVRRAKKIAKAYKVDVEVEGEFAPLTMKATKTTTTTVMKKSVRSTAGDDTSVVQYKDLVQVLDEIEGISKRLEIQAIMTKFFRRIIKFGTPVDMNSAVYLACNSVAPAYECVELGIGDSLLITAISEAYGNTTKYVKDDVNKRGDLGLVAQSCKSRQRTLGFGGKPKPLSLVKVLAVYREIAHISGSSSRKLKIDKIKKLLVATQDSTETKFIIRGLQGKLRIGLAQSTVLVALAHALTMTIPATVRVKDQDDNDVDDTMVDVESKKESNDADGECVDGDSNKSDDPIMKALMDESLPVEKTLEAAANMLRKVYSEVPSYDALLKAVYQVPLIQLNTICHFQPGIPVEPMLAKPTKSIQEVLKRLSGQEFTCEYKYDGERAQIHKTPDGTLKVFSRNLLETSSKYPEVPNYVQEAATGEQVDSFVLDAEVVAYDRKKGHLVPFQILSTRKKTQESTDSATVQVIVQAFDLMYLNGKSLLGKTMKERRKLLKKYFVPVEGKFQFAESLDATEDGDTTVLEQFLDAAVKGQCEGLMVKTMVDIYEPSRRSLNWLKLKKDYLDGVGDSFDLVPLGAYFGRGKRTGVYGAYLLACYNEETEEYQSVCKIGTGFSDEDLVSLSATLNEHKLEGGKSSQYNVTDSLAPDVWFDAVQVWEIKAADLSKSSTHRGAVGKLEEGRGIGLRFPRFERIRDDKKPHNATSSEQVLEMYYNQDSVKGQNGGEDDYDDDGI